MLECKDNISLELDTYDDIFSDFDPRPYSERSLSVDFLDEARRASIDKPSGGLELRVMVPNKLRNIDVEKTIRKRLKTHFERHTKMVKKRYDGVIRMGSAFIAAGIIVMMIATLLYSHEDGGILMNFLIILFEPAGWFLFWEGLDLVIFESKKVRPELKFYEKMAKADIIFLPC